jgi:hypothetical protein
MIEKRLGNIVAKPDGASKVECVSFRRLARAARGGAKPKRRTPDAPFL